MNPFLRTLALASAAVALCTPLAGSAETTQLRIQTHFSPETLSGQMAAEFIEDITAMSKGEIQVEMFYTSAVVKSAETFDAAATGILDCDMTGGSYQTGKNPAFQFAGDLAGGYTNPYQQMAWLLHGGGYDTLNDLYNAHNMEFIGWWIRGPESLSSIRPIRGVDDFKDWKFRSPPGMMTMVFQNLGASPIVMDFNEIFTALETGIIDGADAANLTNNVGLGLYDIVEHTNYPVLALKPLRNQFSSTLSAWVLRGIRNIGCQIASLEVDFKLNFGPETGRSGQISRFGDDSTHLAPGACGQS